MGGFIALSDPPRRVTRVCPSRNQYSVYRGDSEDLLRKSINERATTFCGGSWFLLDSRRCRFQMSPFWHTYVAIKDGKGGWVGGWVAHEGGRARVCSARMLHAVRAPCV
jgi:hypothetical protein